MVEKKCRVLHVYKSSLPDSMGGVEVFLDTLCHLTSKLGIDNTVFSLSKTPKKEGIDYRGYRVVQAKENLHVASTGFSWSAFAHFRRLADEADLIHYCFPNPFADMLHFSLGIKKPFLITYQSDIVKQKFFKKLYFPLMHQFLSRADAIIATSSHYVSTSPVLGNYQEKIKIIPIGLPEASCLSVSDERLAYWKARLPQPFFLFVGVMRYYKGLHAALAAVKGTAIHLVLAGEGGEEVSLKAYASKHALDQVVFLGSVSDEDKAALLTLCYGFVFPSHLRSEAFGIALLEAAMYGKPLIACDIGTGTSFINQDQETGLLIKPNCSDALRQAMQFLLENPLQAKAFGVSARKRYLRHFTADKQADAYLSVYKTMLQAQAASV